MPMPGVHAIRGGAEPLPESPISRSSGQQLLVVSMDAEQLSDPEPP